MTTESSDKSANIEEILPLSPMQRLMLIHELSNPGSTTLNNQFCYRIRGDLVVQRFLRAWQAIVDRHAALRTCFLWDGLETPVQVVRGKAVFDLTYKDIRDLDEENRLQRSAELMTADRHRGIDLRRAPLVRGVLIRLDDRDYELLVSRHHLVMDRWCVELLFDELFRAYASDAPELIAKWPVPGRFGDYLQWQQSLDVRATEGYWRESIGEVSEPTLLFDSSRRSHTRSINIENISLSLDDRSSGAIRDCSQQCRVGLASILQGACALTIATDRRRRDVLFGLTVSGRPPDVPHIEETVGSFINTVPARFRFEDNQTVANWLCEIQQAQGRRSQHEHWSLPDIQRLSKIGAGRAMFDVLLLLQSPLKETLEGPGFTMEQTAGPSESAFPLTLSADTRANCIELSAAYDPVVVGHARAELLLTEFAKSLDDISAGRENPVSSLLPQTIQDLPPSHEPIAEPVAIAEEAGSVEDRMSALFANSLGIERIGIDDDFFAVGGTSLQAAALFADIERSFGRQLPLSTLFGAGSVRAMLEALDSPLRRVSPLVVIQPHGNRIPIFTVPGVGGNVVGLNALARACGPTQPFYGFESPGLDGRVEPLEDIESIAAAYVAAIPSGVKKLALCGLCWGAIVAFEMAQQLTAQGRTPVLLVVLDPAVADSSTIVDTGKSRLRTKLQLLKDRVGLYKEELRPLDAYAKLCWIKDKIKHGANTVLSGEEAVFTNTEIEQQRVTSHNLAAHARYQPGPYAGRAALVLTAREGIGVEEDPRLPWRRLLIGHAAEFNVPGATTGEAVEGQNVAIMASLLTQQIDEATPST